MTEHWQLPVGRIEIGEHYFSSDDIIAFATQFDPQPFHLDAQAARDTVFGELCASGWHTTAAWLTCWTETMARWQEKDRKMGVASVEWGLSPGVRRLKWFRPVYAGERIRFFGEITRVRALATHPGWSLVKQTGTGETEDGEPVLSFTWSVMARVPR